MMLSAPIIFADKDMLKSGEYWTNCKFLIKMSINFPDKSDYKNKKNTKPIMSKKKVKLF